MALKRPGSGDYNAYYDRYVTLVTEDDVLAVMRAQLQATPAFLESLPKERIEHRYAPGKWTLREVIGHVIDMEWVFTARALHFARAVPGALPGVEQDDVMAVANFAARPWSGMIEEYRHLRAANLELFSGFDDAAWARTGVASGNPIRVGAIPFIMAGHERHHLAVIRERYLG